jgi:predicted ArsR family transcriptional regulator
MTKKQLHTTRQTVERLVKANRSISAAEIARQAGVSRERARQILDDLGYELQWRKKAKSEK